MKKMQIVNHKFQFNIFFILTFVTLQVHSQNKTDTLLLKYIQNYKVQYECGDEKVLVPRFANIDSNLYSSIELEFKNQNYNLLYLLIVPVKINHSLYINKFNQEYIIDDGLNCIENSIIKLVRMAMKDSLFIISKSSYEIETTGDILYWVELNKNLIYNYNEIDKYIKKRKSIFNFIKPPFKRSPNCKKKRKELGSIY